MDEDMTLDEALKELADLGYQNVTQQANVQNGPGHEAEYVFLDPSGVGVYYCHNDQDVIDLVLD